MAEELTARYKVHTIGLTVDIDAVSFQDAAKQMLEKRNLVSVVSILVDDQQHGAIEFLNCEIVNGKLTYNDYDVHNTHDESVEALERLDFYASLKEKE